MSKWSSFAAYASMFIALGGFVLGILALLAKEPITAAGTAIVAMVGAYAMDVWATYFRNKENAESVPTPTVIVNAPATVS